MSISDEIAKIQKETEAQLVEVERLKKLEEAFPDVRKHEGRWKKIVFASASVNSKVDRFDRRHNCGCCSDSPLEIWPYLETPHGKVYSDPPMFFVGERSYRGGDTPYPDWRANLEKYGISEAVLNPVSAYLKEPEDDEDEEDP